MQYKKVILSVILMSLTLPILAMPRTKKAMIAVAEKVLNSDVYCVNRSPRKDKIMELDSKPSFSVMGYTSGGFAIISNDDRFPLVIGYSDSKYDKEINNPNFQWYLSSINNIIKKASLDSAAISAIKPDTTLYAAEVESFVRTKWHQLNPFNLLCPIMDSNGNHAPTGCVATAMAQVINYNRYPACGMDSTFTIVTRDDGSSDTLRVNFSKSFYDYNAGTTYGNGSDRTRNYVSRLSYDCGVAVDMTYGKNASGTYSYLISNAMINYFRYPETVRFVSKYPLFGSGVNYSDEEWMNMIFNELNSKRAIIYSGAKPDGKGHAFVLDGYDKNGNVHINWGWLGYQDGYYNMSLLGYDEINYSEDPAMIIGIQKPDTFSTSITSARYATYLSPADVDYSKTASLRAYKVKYDSISNIVTLVPITSVPCGTPVIIEGNEGNYNILNADEIPDEITDNDLKVSDGTIRGYNSTIWALANKSNGVGFYPVADGVTIPAGKAYLVVKIHDATKAKTFLNLNTDATWIENLYVPSTTNGAMYNLSGQQVTKSYKGIVIKNGKKFIKK